VSESEKKVQVCVDGDELRFKFDVHIVCMPHALAGAYIEHFAW